MGAISQALLPPVDLGGRPLPGVVRLGWLGCLLVGGRAALVAAAGCWDGFGLVLAALLLVSLYLVVALVRRRRRALELLGWMALLQTLAATGRNPELGFTSFGPSLLTLAALGFLLAFRGKLLLASPRRSAGRDLAGALRLTLALLLVGEFVSRQVIFASYKALLVTSVAPNCSRREPVPGHPTVATLGSSPANLERQHDRPFSVLLEERLGDTINFLYFRHGGLNTDLLLRKAGELLDGDPRPSAFILYSGFQDLNQFDGLSLLRELDPVGQSSGVQRAVRWAVEQSSLLRLVLYKLWWARQSILVAPGSEKVAVVLEQYQRNIERLLALAERYGCRVFAVTLSLDRSAVAQEAGRYTDQVNDFLRSLPGRHPGITVVDFAAEIANRYPAGRLTDCEPYEAAPEAERCGDPWHLGPRGHEILAGMLEPALLAWRSP